ncbi:MAG: hypothetical protein EBX66_07770 [Betaproteobacteria bacterium]|nr:hypothetical protein [Betaproteobacteria bacterium]
MLSRLIEQASQVGAIRIKHASDCIQVGSQKALPEFEPTALRKLRPTVSRKTLSKPCPSWA